MNPFIRMCREGSQVQRNHTWRTLHTQTVGEHSYNVQCIILEVANTDASAELLRAAIYHDLSEQHIGDPPAPLKWLYPDLTEAYKKANYSFENEWGMRVDLEEHDKVLLKFADSLEFMCFCLEEMRLGNTYAKNPWARIDNFILDFLDKRTHSRYYNGMSKLFGNIRTRSWSVPEGDNYNHANI